MTGLTWRKSTRCQTIDCVEVARTSEFVHVRDSKPGDDTVISFTATDWRSFISALHNSLKT